MTADEAAGAGADLLSNQLAPGIKRMTGYESPKRQAMAIADKADLSSMSSIQDTYKQIQQINPTAATAWLKDVMPIAKEKTARLQQAQAIRDSRGSMQKAVEFSASLEGGCAPGDIECLQRALRVASEYKHRSPETEGARQLAKEQAKSWATMTEVSAVEAKDSSRREATIDQSLAILDSNTVYTGPGGSLVNIAQNIGAMLGVDSSVISAANAKQFLSNSMTTVMEWVSQTKGAISDREMRAFTAAAEGLSTSEGGNRLLLTTLKEVASYNQRVNQELSSWYMKEKREHLKRSPTTPFVPDNYAWEIHRSKWNKGLNPLTGKVNGIKFPTAQEIKAAIGSSGAAESAGANLGDGVTIINVD